MRLSNLYNTLDEWIAQLPESQRNILQSQEAHYRAVYPFNEVELKIALLLANSAMRWDDYLKLRNNYINSNQYLDLFGLAPRVFGEVWAHEHIRSLDSRFQIPNKAIDPNYDGEYDLWIERARVEVKASRAVRKFAKTHLSEKALHSTEQALF